MDRYLEFTAVVRRRVRWLVVTLGVLTLGGVLMAFAHIDRLGQQATYRYGFLIGENRGQYKDEAMAAAAKAFVENPQDPLNVLVPVSDIPTLDRDLYLHVRASMPAETYGLAGQNLSPELFSIAVLLIPTVLLVALIATFRHEAMLHRKLVPWATSGSEVQCRLNSLYFDRLTENYLDGWKRHVWTGGVGILLLVLLCVWMISTRSTMILDTRILVDAMGVVAPAVKDPRSTPVLFEPKQSMILFLLGLLTVNITLWAILMWYVLRRVPAPGIVSEGALADPV